MVEIDISHAFSAYLQHSIHPQVPRMYLTRTMHVMTPALMVMWFWSVSSCNSWQGRGCCLQLVATSRFTNNKLCSSQVLKKQKHAMLPKKYLIVGLLVYLLVFAHQLQCRSLWLVSSSANRIMFTWFSPPSYLFLSSCDCLSHDT